MKIDLEKPIDLSKPSLEGLAMLLRTEELWPKGYQWSFLDVAEALHERVEGISINQPGAYQRCGTHGCAIGLAYEMWPEIQTRHQYMGESIDNIAEATGISSMDAHCLFWETDTYYPGHVHEEVTPVMVADAIDRYLAERNGSYL